MRMKGRDNRKFLELEAYFRFAYSLMMHNKDTSWNAVADWYDDLLADTGSYQQQVILPNLTRLLGDVSGKKILDLASGQGFFSHALAQAGAQVVGVEISPELVQYAKKNATKHEQFMVGDAEKLPKEIVSGAFDLCLCVLTLQNIRNLDAVISEASRALVSRGRFFIVLNHPAFRIPKHSAWGFDDDRKLQYRRLDGYLSESQENIAMHPGTQGSPETSSFHRPLQVYFKSFGKHGFVVERLEEWISHKESSPGPRKTAEDRARKEFPLFLFLGLCKK